MNIGADIHVSHFVPGRVRLRVAAIKGNPRLAERIRSAFRDVPGLTGLHEQPPVRMRNWSSAGWVGQHRRDLVRAPSIPEPETWVLLLVGLGLVGWAGRRRPA